MDVGEHSRELIERGYTVFERLCPPEWVAALRADIESIHEQVDARAGAGARRLSWVVHLRG